MPGIKKRSVLARAWSWTRTTRGVIEQAAALLILLG